MKEEIRINLMTARILQFCADIFAVFGVILFGYIYFHSFSDNPVHALRDPFFVVTILIPFLPAAVLAFAASRKRKKVQAMVDRMNAEKSGGQ
ncbi:MAG: hypothetical protein DI626_07840 [Micavibrio aeruginosavorus]|uniref:Uncharacterized protein n=1 Tax=Micavibrio aeruginosavorus TaxID=349221 RepID=A0A2W4ZRL8_9BACT|nr:MAG: hypothetical protein DI626_07840 [Micavibrio aeruginosavorus]